MKEVLAIHVVIMTQAIVSNDYNLMYQFYLKVACPLSVHTNGWQNFINALQYNEGHFNITN